MDVKGVGALVTGGGSGMGAATARALAAAGARVGVIDLSRETAEAVANEIGGLGLACDVSDAATAEAVVKKASAAHGPCWSTAPVSRLPSALSAATARWTLPTSRRSSGSI